MSDPRTTNRLTDKVTLSLWLIYFIELVAMLIGFVIGKGWL